MVSLAKHPLPAPTIYIVEFIYAPTHLAFILDKRPAFASKDKAFALLRHYVEEFGVDGVVVDEMGRVQHDVENYGTEEATA